MNPLELVALNSSQWLWSELEEALDLKFILHEVACTDFFLKRLKKEGGHRLIVETVTDEVSVGADWEWWFMTEAGYALPVRVQAKVMFMEPAKRISRADNPRYEKLHYFPIRAYFRQTETLIQRAHSESMFPLYCLYTHFNDQFIKKVPSSNCSYYPGVPQAFGAALIGAESVRWTKSRSLAALFPEVHGLPCLFRDIHSLLHLEKRMRYLWPHTGKIISTGRDRFGEPIAADTVRERNEFIRTPDDVPEYVRLLHGAALERLDFLTGNLQRDETTGPIQSDSSQEDDRIIYNFPQNTSRATVFLIPGIEYGG